MWDGLSEGVPYFTWEFTWKLGRLLLLGGKVGTGRKGIETWNFGWSELDLSLHLSGRKPPWETEFWGTWLQARFCEAEDLSVACWTDPSSALARLVATASCSPFHRLPEGTAP